MAQPLEDPTDEERARALQRFIEGARDMGFKSDGNYPTRDELHERRGYERVNEPEPS